MIPYQPEELKAAKFHGRLIYILQYPEWDEEGVVVNHIIDQLGLADQKEDLLHQTLYDLKFLAQVVHVDDQGTTHELVVIPISKLNAWLFAIKLPKGSAEVWFTQEVLDGHGEILEERVNLRDNLRKYQAECCAVLYSYWNNGMAINPNAGQPFAGLTSLWRASRGNLDKVLRLFSEYAELQGEEYSVKTLRHGITILLSEFLPQSLVLKPEESRNGFDLYRLALAEDYIARYFNQAIEDQLVPSQVITMIDADLIAAFHQLAQGLLQAINEWSLPISPEKPV